jgi:uncharacterized membrane protein YtjA (UPF0391 family)
MNSFVLKPWRWVATFFRISLSTTFFGGTRSAVFLTGWAVAVFLAFVILRVTFLPVGRVRPDDFGLGAARRTAPRETVEVLRLPPAVLFFELFFTF